MLGKKNTQKAQESSQGVNEQKDKYNKGVISVREIPQAFVFFHLSKKILQLYLSSHDRSHELSIIRSKIGNALGRLIDCVRLLYCW